MTPMLTRRDLLTLIAYAGLASTSSFSQTAFASEKALRKAFKRLAKNPNIEELKTVGGLYLVSAPDESDITFLLQSLPDADTVDQAYWDDMENQVQSDFKNGETVTLDGWILARSECRLYGLLHLVSA